MPNENMSQSAAEVEQAEDSAYADFIASMEEELAAVEAGFEGLMRRVVYRLVGEGSEADQALAQGALEIQDCTVVMRRNPDNDYIELFGDVGAPVLHAEQAAYRAALEINLCRTYPGLTLGVHPQSGRIVATIACHSVMMSEVDICVRMLELLVSQIRQLRSSQVMPLQASA